MNDLLFQLIGATVGLTLQVGFAGEVETVQWWGWANSSLAPLNDLTSFFPVPQGPVLFQTLTNPPVVDATLEIAEWPDPLGIAQWMKGKSLLPTVRTFVLPANQNFKQFIPVSGPYIGLKLLGNSALTVTAEGLVSMAPSTLIRTPQPIRVIVPAF